MKTIGEIVEQLTITKNDVDAWGEHKTDFKIKNTQSFSEDVVKYYREEISSGYPLPFRKTEETFRVRKGELTIITGVSGHGKSMWLSQVILYLTKMTKCLIASMEMRPVITIARMINQTGNNNPTDIYIKDFCEKKKDSLYIYDQTGSTSADDIFSTIMWGKEVEDINIFVVDSLMKIDSVSEVDMDAQKKFVDRLAVLCRDLNVHIFLVCHTKKLMDETMMPDATNILGSSHIRNLADNIICVWRNRAKERDREAQKLTEEQERMIPDCKVVVQKQRNFPAEPTYNFWFDDSHLKYKEHY